MVGAGLLRQQFRLPHQLFDPNVVAVHPRPAGAMPPDIDVQKISVVHPNTALGELRHLRRQLVHLLQREAGQADIGGQPAGVLAVGDSAYLLVVARAAVAGVDDYGHTGEDAENLQALDQVRIQLQPATTAAFKFFSRKMLTQISPSGRTPTRNCLLNNIGQK
jgi:hypothetical protein